MQSLAGIMRPLTRPAGLGTQSYRDLIVSHAPVAYWRLGEASGTTAVDEMGAYNGTYTGGYTLAQAGALTGDANTAVAFNGTTSYVVTTSNLYNMGIRRAATLECWVRLSLDSTSGINELISDWNSVGVSLRAYNTGSIEAFVYPNNYRATSATGVLTANANTHVVAVLDTTTLKLYRNGAEVKSVALGGDIGSSASPLRIGMRADANLSTAAKGVIDEPAVYSRALSATEIAAHYNKGIGAS